MIERHYRDHTRECLPPQSEIKCYAVIELLGKLFSVEATVVIQDYSSLAIAFHFPVHQIFEIIEENSVTSKTPDRNGISDSTIVYRRQVYMREEINKLGFQLFSLDDGKEIFLSWKSAV